MTHWKPTRSDIWAELSDCVRWTVVTLGVMFVLGMGPDGY